MGSFSNRPIFRLPHLPVLVGSDTHVSHAPPLAILGEPWFAMRQEFFTSPFATAYQVRDEIHFHHHRFGRDKANHYPPVLGRERGGK